MATAAQRPDGHAASPHIGILINHSDLFTEKVLKRLDVGYDPARQILSPEILHQRAGEGGSEAWVSC